MIRFILAALIALACAGCAITVPCAAKASNGMTFIGSATATMSSKPGTFELYSTTGLKCYGTYNQWDTNLTIRVPSEIAKTNGLWNLAPRTGALRDFWIRSAA